MYLKKEKLLSSYFFNDDLSTLSMLSMRVRDYTTETEDAMSGSGFLTRGEGGQPAGEVPTLGVGMLGYAFMGKAHTNAFKKLDYIYTPPPAHVRLVAIAGRDQEKVQAAANRYGYEKAVTDWHALVNDPDIQVFDNGAPNHLHAESCIAAAKAGKHIICEKPLGRTGAEAKAMWDAARQAGIVHMCAFNYRFVPAIRLAREIIKAGRLGRIYHFRARYRSEERRVGKECRSRWSP